MSTARALTRALGSLALVAALAGCVPAIPTTDEVADQARQTLDEVTSAQQIARRVTVRVRNRGCGELRTGSGVVVAPDLIVTNRHVVESAQAVEVNTWDGKSLEVDVTSVATTSDLGLLRVEGELPAPVVEADSDPAQGDQVVVAGYPGGEDLVLLEGPVLGAAEDVLDEPGPVLVIDTPVQPGNSGGPVLDQDGRLGAIVFAADLDAGTALAIPLSRFRDVSETAEFSEAPPCTEDDESPIELGTLELPEAPTTTTPVPCPTGSPTIATTDATVTPTGGESLWTVNAAGTIGNPTTAEVQIVEVTVRVAAPGSPTPLEITQALNRAVPPGDSTVWQVTGEVSSPVEPLPQSAGFSWRFTDPGLALRCS